MEELKRYKMLQYPDENIFIAYQFKVIANVTKN